MHALASPLEGLLTEAPDLAAEFEAPGQLKARLALKALLMPGSLGSTHKVLVFSRGID